MTDHSDLIRRAREWMPKRPKWDDGIHIRPVLRDLCNALEAEQRKAEEWQQRCGHLWRRSGSPEYENMPWLQELEAMARKERSR